MNSKNILYITVTSEIGGGPEHIYNLMKEMNNEKYNIYIAAPDNGEYYNKFQNNSKDIFDLKLNPFSIQNLFKLRNIIKKNNITIVHSHGKGAGIYSRLLKILISSVEIVHTFHGIHYQDYNFLIKNIYCGIENFLKYFTDYFISVSHNEFNKAKKLGFLTKDKTKMIYNGIDLKKFNKRNYNIDKLYDELDLSKSEIIIGNVARFNIQKGHKYLIQAFNKLIKEIPNCKLVLAGDGKLRKEIEDLVQKFSLNDKVIFLGFRNDIPKLMRLFDIFVFPSLWEGLPFTLLEALASEVPVVATDVIGNNEIIRDQYNGVLCEPKDSQDLLKKLKLIIKNKSNWEKYTDNGIKIIKQNFTVENMVEETTKLYDNI